MRRTLLRTAALALLLVSLGGCEEEWKPDVRVVSTAMIKGFDPIGTGDTYSSGAQGQVFEGLYEYHYLKRPFELRPSIADGMPEVSEDGLTYTFKLKKDIVFQDADCFPGGTGRAVKADDFVYCLKRLMAVPSSTGSWVLQGKIAGLDEWAARCGQKLSEVYDIVNEYYPFEHPDVAPFIDEEVAGLRALDDHTLQITLVEPYPQFMWTLAMSYTVAYPREAVETYGMGVQTKPVGSGPYICKQYWPFDLKVQLERNPTYREDYYPSEGAPGDEERGLLRDAGKRLPLADKVEIAIVQNASPRWLKFLEGQIDRVETEKDIWGEAMELDGTLREDVADAGIWVDIDSKADLAYTGFNMDDPIIGAPAGEKGKKIRQAICLAYDQQGWIKVMRNGFWSMPATGPIPPGMAGWVDVVSPYSGRNVERAKELLAEAGYPEGRGLPVIEYELSGTTSVNRNGAEILRSSCAEIGIELKLNGQTWDQFTDKVRDKNAQMFGMAWIADYPDAQNFLQLFYGPYESPGSNGSNYKNPAYDALYNRMKLMQPGPERDVIIREMVAIVNEDCPWSYTDYRVQYTYLQEWLQNFKFHSINTFPLKYYGVDRDARQKRIGEARD